MSNGIDKTYTAGCDDGLVIRSHKDAEGFGLLYDAYYEKLFKYCIHRLYDRDIAEEVLGEIFFYLANTIAMTRPSSDKAFAGWAYRVANRKINRRLKTMLRRRQLAVIIAQAEPPETNILDEDDKKIIWPMLYEAMMQLSFSRQNIITLRFLEGFKAAEISEIMRTGPDRVRDQITAAIGQLREILNQKLTRAGLKKE